MKVSRDKLYHVTHTKYVPSIRKRGLVMFASPTNWSMANGERYGDGSIYAFDHLEDAIRWAAKMGWTHYRDTGTDKVSIIAFDPGSEGWEVDGADPLSHAMSKGRWLKASTRVQPAQILQIWGMTPEMVRQLMQERI